MKKFKNLSTGLIEEVDNKAVIEQMEKYPEYYEEVKASNKGADKTEKAGKGGEKTASNKGADKTENGKIQILQKLQMKNLKLNS